MRIFVGLTQINRRHVHREHVPGHARAWSTWSGTPRPWAIPIFWITGRGDSQHAGDDRQPGERRRGRVAGHPHREPAPGRPSRRSTPVTRRPRRSTPATAASPTACSPSRRSGSYPAYLDKPEFCGRVHRQPASPARPSSTSPARAPTSSRRATRSSPTSATSSATRAAASRTRRSRCRTRTTTSRRRLAQTSSDYGPSSEGPWSFSGLYGRTKPMRSYICSSVGADASRAFSAPTPSRRSKLGSGRSAAPRSARGSARTAPPPPRRPPALKAP